MNIYGISFAAMFAGIAVAGCNRPPFQNANAVPVRQLATTEPSSIPQSSVMSNDKCIALARNALRIQRGSYVSYIGGTDTGRRRIVVFLARRQEGGEFAVPKMLRITVDTWTGETSNPRGPYAVNELELIRSDRAAGVMTPDEAISLADRYVEECFPTRQNVSPPTADRIRIDLIAGRFYVMRYSAPLTIDIPGTNVPEYILEVYVDGLERRVTGRSIG